MQLDLQFRLASLSKPFMAMAIMILKEQGKLTDAVESFKLIVEFYPDD